MFLVMKNIMIVDIIFKGSIVGFSGSRVFYLYGNSVSTIEVPLSNQLYQHLERDNFK